MNTFSTNCWEAEGKFIEIWLQWGFLGLEEIFFSFPFPLPDLSASPCAAIPLNLVKVLEDLSLSGNLPFSSWCLWW